MGYELQGYIENGGYTNNIPDPNLYLIPIQAHQWANAAELLRDYNGWDRNDFEKFKTWMKDTFYSVSNMFLKNHNGGQGNNALLAKLGSGSDDIYSFHWNIV